MELRQTCACGAVLEVAGDSLDIGWRQADFHREHRECLKEQ